MGNLKVSRGLQQSLVFGKGSKLNIEFRYLQDEQRSKVNAEFHHKVAACSVSSVDQFLLLCMFLLTVLRECGTGSQLFFSFRFVSEGRF